MNPIEALPDFNWNEIAEREIKMTGPELLAQSDFAWSIGSVAVCGLIYRTLTSPPWFWFALSVGVTFRDLIDFRRLATLIPKGTTTAISEDFPLAKRFAEFYGFVNTGHAYDGYMIYRRS